MDKKNWEEWHEKYDDESSDLSERLKIVRNEIKKALPESIEAKFRILDICAGDGRDLIPVLKEYSHHELVEARLIEMNQVLGSKARATAQTVGLKNIEVVIGDAARTDSYLSIVPANLILLCGVFGNIWDEDVEKIITALPEFCKRGSKVIWTRNRREPDMTPRIRKLFSNNGFSEVKFVTPEGNTYAVGVSEYKQQPLPYKGDRSLFSFIR